MKVNKLLTIDELGLKHFGSKGWMNSEETKCPICNRSDKFGILFTDKGGVTHCFYECGDNIPLSKYLKLINREHLVEYEQQVSMGGKIATLNSEENKEEEISEVELPKGYERIYYDPYLKSRNFKSYQYDQFEVGITNHHLERKLHNQLIFVMIQKGRRVAWLSRSKKSKEWHKQNLEQSKLGNERLVLRYRNSENTDFERILGGFDEITSGTHTVIVVEGLFDKTNISNLLQTNKSEELKVVFTFGNSMSPYQINLLRETGVNTVILMYDANTVEISKKYSTTLSKWFDTYVCDIENEDIDPGNIDEIYLKEILNNKKNFLYFYTLKLKSKINCNDRKK